MKMENFLKINIENLILNEKISLTKFSNDTGVPISTLSRVINGIIKKPSRTTINLIADYFNISPEILMYRNINSSNHLNSSGIECKHTSIKDRVIYLMKINKILSITELSTMTGIPNETLHGIIVKGANNPEYETCAKLASFFSITIPQIKCELDLTHDDLKNAVFVDQKNLAPVISINNAEKWINNKNENFILTYHPVEKSMFKQGLFFLKNNPKLFSHEFENSNLILLEPTDVISKDGYYLADIFGNVNIFSIKSTKKEIYYRVSGSHNKQLINEQSVNIFAKVINIIMNY